MKRIFFFLYVSIGVNSLFAQKDIGVLFNSCHSGRTIDLIYGSRVNNTKILLGISTNVNRIAHEDDLQLYHKKRLFVSGIENLFGLHFAYNKYFKINKIDQEIYFFSDLQLKYAGTRNTEFKKIFYDSINDIQYYYQYNLYYGPFLWVQNNFGLGFDIKIFNNIFLSEKIGYGIEYVYGKDTKFNASKNKSWLYGALIFNVGINFKL